MDAPASFEYAREAVSQLITLSTALIGVSVTFAKDLPGLSTPKSRKLLYGAWVVLLLSIICGIWTLLAMTGSLTVLEGGKAATINDWNIKIPAMLLMLLFLLGVLLLIVHAIAGRNSESPTN